MEASLSSSWYIGTHLQASNEGYLNMASSLLLEEQGTVSPFMASSPSLDMEAALQHLSSSSYDSELSSSPLSPDSTDVLMVDPFLDFLNEVLMEEGMEDSPSPISVLDADAYYQATLSSLYDIISENSPSASTTSEGESAARLSHQYVPSHDPTIHENFTGFDLSHSWEKGSQFEQQLHDNKPYVVPSSSTGENKNLVVSRSLLPAGGNSLMRLEEEESENNSLSASCDSSLSLDQRNRETSASPASGNPHFSLKQVNPESHFRSARSSAHISLDQGKPETLPRLRDSSLSPVEMGLYYQHVKRSYASEHAALRGFSDSSFNGGESQGLDHGTDDSHIDAESTSNLVTIDVQIEDLKDEAGYAALYIGKPTATSTLKGSRQNGDKKSSNGAQKGRKSGRIVSTEVLGFVDVREVLVSCAQAVAIGDGKRANEILQELYQVHGVTFNGNSLQRAAHYFCEALVARMGGVGGQRYRDMCANAPSAAIYLKITKVWFERSPYMRIMHYFANQNILKAAEGASRLHIVDYGTMYGMQWPCLINALADREGGPPSLVITGIEFPKPGQNTLEWLEENGRRLSLYAKTYNVPFQFHAIVTDKWEDIGPASLNLHVDEVLVVNCMKRLRHLADECVELDLTVSPRQKLLMSMHSLKPHLLLTGDSNAAFNSPFFVSRFREALYFYTNMFDMVDALWNDQPSERIFVETNFYRRDILNVVACEGAERVERLETYKQWDARIKRAGFEQLPVPSVVLFSSISHVKQHYHKDFMVHVDGKGWMLLGWKGRPTLAMSAWVPSHV